MIAESGAKTASPCEARTARGPAASIAAALLMHISGSYKSEPAVALMAKLLSAASGCFVANTQQTREGAALLRGMRIPRRPLLTHVLLFCPGPVATATWIVVRPPVAHRRKPTSVLAV